MSLWQIAARNVWQSRGRYLAYLASSAFAVMIFFLYSALIYHPDLQSGYKGATYVLQGMKGAAVVIAIFTFLFLLYSNSAFVRSRMKEFGLLSLMGVSRRQLAGLILLESLLVGGVAVLSGVGVGLLFLKLFFMAISTLLQLPAQIPFYAGPKVWLYTLAVFGSFFIVVSLASLRSVLQRNIVELVRAGRQPKGAPTFSRGKTVLGALLLLGGYAWASIPNPVAVILGIVPVTILVSIGTFLLMREGSIAFLAWLHKRERFFYRPGPFLNVSQLVYKMQDNYRVLTAVAILVAVILTAVGTAYTLYALTVSDSVDSHPHAIQLIQPASAGSDVTKVETVLQKHGVSGLTAHELVLRKATLTRDRTELTLVPYSFYAGVQRRSGERLALAGADQAIAVSHMVVPAKYRGGMTAPRAEQLLVDGRTIPLTVTTDFSGRVTNAAGEFGSVLVLDDTLFAQLMSAAPAEQRIRYTFWSGPSWQSRPMQKAAAELRTLYGEDAMTLSMTVEVYRGAMSAMGLILFIGVFVSLVFFAACFSLLYFRLFTEIEEDRKYFRRLQQVGVSGPELKRLALRQAGVIFFVPFLAGLLHSTFAMQALGMLTSRTVLPYGWAMALGYLVLYGVCFRATYGSYWKALRVAG